MVGLELKEEFVVGKLRDPRAAALPIAAAIAGVATPALVFLAVNGNAGDEARHGWAIPTATDIAFAVAVLAVVGRSLPPALRTFLLTLAIVDDLVAITIIATVFTDDLAFWPLLAAFVPLAVFALAVQRGSRAWFVLLPLAILTWALIHASGIHATVAGVLLAFAVPVKATDRARVLVGTDEDGRRVYDGMTAHFADRWEVISGTVAVPVFAFFATGVTVGGLAGLSLPSATPSPSGSWPGSWSASSSASPAPWRCSPVRRGSGLIPPSPGPTSSGCRSSPGSASPLPCLSATCPTQRPRPLTRTSRWASSPDR